MPGAKHNRTRRIVRRLHLWLGLTLGALFAMSGLTGSALVFYTALDQALNPVLAGEVGAGPVRWETALRTVRASFPDKTGPWRFEVTPGQTGPVPARYYDPPETADRDFAPMMVWLSPDASRVLRRDFWGNYAMTWIYDLHYQLQMGDRGKMIMGYAGIALTLLLLSGVWAWWPRPGTWRKALRFKARAAPQRRLYDWHKLAGLWGLAVLVVLTVTGVMLALPQETDAALAATVSSVDVMPVPESRFAGGSVISVDAAVSAARRALPLARLAWIETPRGPNGTFRLRLQQPADPSARFPHSYVWIDQYSGAVLAIYDVGKGSRATTVAAWLHPLHDGSAGGLPLRWLVFIAGLVPSLLFATGFLRWRRDKRAERRQSRVANVLTASVVTQN